MNNRKTVSLAWYVAFSLVAMASVAVAGIFANHAPQSAWLPPIVSVALLAAMAMLTIFREAAFGRMLKPTTMDHVDLQWNDPCFSETFGQCRFEGVLFRVNAKPAFVLLQTHRGGQFVVSDPGFIYSSESAFKVANPFWAQRIEVSGCGRQEFQTASGVILEPGDEVFIGKDGKAYPMERFNEDRDRNAPRGMILRSSIGSSARDPMLKPDDIIAKIDATPKAMPAGTISREDLQRAMAVDGPVTPLKDAIWKSEVEKLCIEAEKIREAAKE